MGPPGVTKRCAYCKGWAVGPIPGLQVEAVLPPVFSVPECSFSRRRLHHVLLTPENLKQLVQLGFRWSIDPKFEYVDQRIGMCVPARFDPRSMRGQVLQGFVLEVGVRLVRLGEPKRPGSETFRDNDQRSQMSTTRVVVSHIEEVRRVHNAIHNMQIVVSYSGTQTIIGNLQCASTAPCRQSSAFIHSSPFNSDHDRR